MNYPTYIEPIPKIGLYLRVSVEASKELRKRALQQKKTMTAIFEEMFSPEGDPDREEACADLDFS